MVSKTVCVMSPYVHQSYDTSMAFTITQHGICMLLQLQAFNRAIHYQPGIIKETYTSTDPQSTRHQLVN